MQNIHDIVVPISSDKKNSQPNNFPIIYIYI